MCADQIPDDEILYRRIPPGRPWIDAADVTTANFKLNRKSGEEGISVYRKAIISADHVLALPVLWSAASWLKPPPVKFEYFAMASGLISI